MKKQILVLAGSALILASCGNNDAQQKANDQAKIDSITKANTEMQDAINKAKNDSTINAMAKAKADSMDLASKAAEKTKSGGTKKGGTKKDPAPVVTPTVAPVKTSQDNKFDSRHPGSETTKPVLTPDQQKAQDDKFNRRRK